MARWTYRTVEAALYGLGKDAEPPPRQSSMSVPSRGSRSFTGSTGFSETEPRIDFTLSLRRSLSEEELGVVKEQYIIGVRRHGYRRRAPIIKKLVDALNEPENPAGDS